MLKYFFVSFLIFCLSFWGIFLTRKNFLIILMSIEMMLLSINLNFIIFSVVLDDIFGQLFSLFVLTVAAGESAVGLALLVIYYRIKGIISIDYISSLKG